MDKQNALEIFSNLEKHNPQPQIELYSTNEFTLLIAIVLSAQSTDKRVNIVTKDLFKEISSPNDVISMGVNALEERIKTIGLYKNKAKNIVSLSELLIEKFDCEVPSDIGELTSLPGVGRKTANVWLNTVHGFPGIAVDTHVMRVSARLNLSSGKTPVEIEQDLYKVVPDVYHSRVSNWLVLHGRYICKAKKPICQECFLKGCCKYYAEHR